MCVLTPVRADVRWVACGPPVGGVGPGADGGEVAEVTAVPLQTAHHRLDELRSHVEDGRLPAHVGHQTRPGGPENEARCSKLPSARRNVKFKKVN